jgi:hypothetical protein
MYKGQSLSTGWLLVQVEVEVEASSGTRTALEG